MDKQSKKGIVIFSVIIAVVIAVVAVTTVMQIRYHKLLNGSSISNAEVSDSSADLSTKSYKKEFIASLYIEGVIEEKNYQYDQEWLMKTIHSLKQNKNNAALAIYIDSPGGGVYQADEVYLALQDYKTTGRPVFVYQGPMAASGGYYISCAADQIYANRNTLTGCIGVIFGQSLDITGLLDKLGIKSKTFHTGRNKTMLSPDEPLTAEQEAIMQSMCDEAYEQFVSIVAKGRNMKCEEAAELSDGRLYTAKQGLENGLVDRIDSWDNMITVLAEDVLEKPGIKVVEYKKEEEGPGFLNMMMSGVSTLQKQEAAAKLGVPTSVIDYYEFDSYPAYLYTGN